MLGLKNGQSGTIGMFRDSKRFLTINKWKPRKGSREFILSL